MKEIAKTIYVEEEEIFGEVPRKKAKKDPSLSLIFGSKYNVRCTDSLEHEFELYLSCNQIPMDGKYMNKNIL